MISICVCLPQFQQSLSESEFKEDDNETEHNSTAAPHRNETKKKRKKRKKRSGTGKHGAYQRSSEDNADVIDSFTTKHLLTMR